MFFTPSYTISTSLPSLPDINSLLSPIEQFKHYIGERFDYTIQDHECVQKCCKSAETMIQPYLNNPAELQNQLDEIIELFKKALHETDYLFDSEAQCLFETFEKEIYALIRSKCCSILAQSFNRMMEQTHADNRFGFLCQWAELFFQSAQFFASREKLHPYDYDSTKALLNETTDALVLHDWLHIETDEKKKTMWAIFSTAKYARLKGVPLDLQSACFDHYMNLRNS